MRLKLDDGRFEVLKERGFDIREVRHDKKMSKKHDKKVLTKYVQHKMFAKKSKPEPNIDI